MPDDLTSLARGNLNFALARREMLTALRELLADRAIPDAEKQAEIRATVSAVEQIAALSSTDG